MVWIPQGTRRDQAPEKGGRDAPGRPFVQIREGELARAVDRHEQLELALRGAQLGGVNVEEADRAGFDRFPRLGSIDVRQPADAVAPGTPIQRQAGQSGMLARRKWRQPSSGSKLCFRKAPTVASSSRPRTLERLLFGPIGPSRTKSRFRHFASVFGLTP